MFEHITKVYQAHTYKVILYPFALSVIGGFLGLGVAGKWRDFGLEFLIPGVLFGLSSACLNMSFGLKVSVWHSILLMGLVPLCYFLGLAAGTIAIYLPFVNSISAGPYIVCVLAGNISFAIILFLMDYLACKRTIHFSWITVYLVSAAAATVVFCGIVGFLISKEKGSEIISVLLYIIEAYIFLQVSIWMRLMFVFPR